MGSFEVQGIVAASTGEPFVQMFITIDEEQTVLFQVNPEEAREIAQHIQEAATNAVYEAALIGWAKDRDPENGEAMGAHLVGAVREFRTDKWGTPPGPDDWSKKVD